MSCCISLRSFCTGATFFSAPLTKISLPRDEILTPNSSSSMRRFSSWLPNSVWVPSSSNVSSICAFQYRFIDGSTSTAHLSIPPATDTASLPCPSSHAAAWYDRCPAWHTTAIVRPSGISCKRCGNELIGMSCEPSMRQISASHGSRTSTTTGGSSPRSIASSCLGVISRTSAICAFREERHRHVAVLRAAGLGPAAQLCGERLRAPAMLDRHQRVVAQLQPLVERQQQFVVLFVAVRRIGVDEVERLAAEAGDRGERVVVHDRDRLRPRLRQVRDRSGGAPVALHRRRRRRAR